MLSHMEGRISLSGAFLEGNPCLLGMSQFCVFVANIGILMPSSATAAFRREICHKSDSFIWRTQDLPEFSLVWLHGLWSSWGFHNHLDSWLCFYNPILTSLWFLSFTSLVSGLPGWLGWQSPFWLSWRFITTTDRRTCSTAWSMRRSCC